MPRLSVKPMKELLVRGLFVAAVTALIGFQTTGAAAQAAQLWSIVIHFQYQDGFEFDYVLERGVPAEDVSAALADCGSSHRFASPVMHYHCYALPE